MTIKKFVTTAAVAAATIILAAPGTASAHHPVITATPSIECDQDYWTATFTASSDEVRWNEWRSQHRFDESGPFVNDSGVAGWSAWVPDSALYGPITRQVSLDQSSLTITVKSQFRWQAQNSSDDSRSVTVKKPDAPTCETTTTTTVPEETTTTTTEPEVTTTTTEPDVTTTVPDDTTTTTQPDDTTTVPDDSTTTTEPDVTTTVPDDTTTVPDDTSTTTQPDAVTTTTPDDPTTTVEVGSEGPTTTVPLPDQPDTTPVDSQVSQEGPVGTPVPTLPQTGADATTGLTVTALSLLGLGLVASAASRRRTA